MPSVPGRGNTSKRPDNKPAGQLVSFTRGAADRIAKVVRTVERGDTGAKGLTFGRPPAGEAGKVFRICQFTGTWAIDSNRTIQFRNQTATPNTVTAVNLFAKVGVTNSATITPCAIAKEGTAWYLIAAKCS